MMNKSISVLPLGQAGFRFEYKGTVIFIDPYLSNYVEEVEGDSLNRIVPIKIEPTKINDADFVFITHEHIDHCDPKTLLPLSIASNKAIFIAPKILHKVLIDIGIDVARIVTAEKNWHSLNSNIKFKSVPAAHPELDIDIEGNHRYVGYLFDFGGKKLYHSGDTSVHKQIIKILKNESPIDIAFLSVNEKNYYKDERGIIGNMTLREAFQLAEDIGVSVFVPMHWDMFEDNYVYEEEIELIYNKISPNFIMKINPKEV